MFNRFFFLVFFSYFYFKKDQIFNERNNKSERNWLPASVTSLPKTAVQAGYDVDGDPIYVGRILRKGEMLPVKVIPNKGRAYAAWDGAEHVTKEAELLRGRYYGKFNHYCLPM